MAKFRNTTRAIIFNEKEELLVVKMGNVHGIPGGGIDFGESMANSLARETKEELNIEGVFDKVIFLQEYMAERKGEMTHFFETFCTVKNNKNFENVTEKYKEGTHSFEVHKIGWFKLDNVPKDFMPMELIPVLKEYLKNKNKYNIEYFSGIEGN